MSDQQVAIYKILSAEKMEDYFTLDLSSGSGYFDDKYKQTVKLIHPDKCNLIGASDAMVKLSQWKKFYFNGKEYTDDAGKFCTNYYWAKFVADDAGKNNHGWSLENYRIFQGLKGDLNSDFKKYIPKECSVASDGSYTFRFEKRSIPISGLTLPQEHVNWILNRLLEYCSYIEQIGFQHLGLNPESVFIIPEVHGIQVCSWYHQTKRGCRIGTVSGKYKNWYPQSIFDTKIAEFGADVEMAKRIAAYLLGDKSGVGIRLRKTHNEDFVNFITSYHDTAYEAYIKYKKLLEKNFKKQFHNLSI